MDSAIPFKLELREAYCFTSTANQLNILVCRVFNAGTSIDWRGYSQGHRRRNEKIFVACAQLLLPLEFPLKNSNTSSSSIEANPVGTWIHIVAQRSRFRCPTALRLAFLAAPADLNVNVVLIRAQLFLYGGLTGGPQPDANRFTILAFRIVESLNCTL